MRLLSFLLICVAFTPIPAHSQAVVDHFVGPTTGPGFRDGAGAQARFNAPEGVWADAENVYIADSQNAVIRKIVLGTGQVSTLAGSPQETKPFSNPRALWGDGKFLYVADSSVIQKVDLATGAVSLFVDQWSPESRTAGAPYALKGNSTRLYAFYSLTTYITGSTYFDAGIAIREISLSSGEARTLPASAYGSVVPSASWADDQYLYFAYTSTVGGISLARMNVSTDEFEPLFGFPLPQFTAGQSFVPQNLWGDGAGNLFFSHSNAVADSTTRTIVYEPNPTNVYEVELASGKVTLVATAPATRQSRIGGLSGAGTFLFGTDAVANTVFRVDVSRKQATNIAGQANTFQPDYYPPPASSLNGVRGIWSDGKFVYAADYNSNVIDKIDLGSGQSSIFVSNIRGPMGVWGDAAFLYVAQADAKIISKVSLATGEVSQLSTGLVHPNAITGDGNFLYVADSNAIRRVSKTTGAVTTLAGQPDAYGYANGTGTDARFPGIRALWTDGTIVYAVDAQTVRRIVIATGEVGTFAGLPGSVGFKDGIGTQAAFGPLLGVAGGGTSLYVFDSSTVRRIALLNAEVTTIAGSPVGVGSYEDGIGEAARFGGFGALWTDGRSVYVGDGRLRKLDLSTRAVTTITGSNILLSQGVIPSDQFVTRNLTGNGDFLYAVSGYAVYKISLKTREIRHLAGAYNESGQADGRGNNARFASPTVLWSDGRYLYVDEYVYSRIRRVDTETGDVTTFATGIELNAAWGNGNYLYGVADLRSIYRIDLRRGEKTLLVAPGPWTFAGIWGDGTYLYLADARGCAIVKVNVNTGESAVLAGHFGNCQTIDVQPPVDGIGADAFFPNLRAITGDGHLLYVVDSTTVRSVDPQTGETHTVAGQYPISGVEDGIGSDAHLLKSGALATGIWSGKLSAAIWSDGTNLYVANEAIRRVTLTHPLSKVPFDFGATGGDYWKTTSSSATVRVGYGRLQTSAGSRAPGAVAIFSYRPNGVLVSEASVPASAPVQAGRIYVEVNGPVNTGFAIANPNNQPATVSYYYTDASGVNFGASTATIGPNSQVAAFLNEAPFRPASSTDSVAQARSFTFSSSVPVGVIALRGYTNERSEFLMTTLPVAPVSSSSTASIILPHFADGGGWRTQVLLVNPTDQPVQGTLQMDSSFDYQIAPRSSVNIATSGVGEAIRTGTVHINPAAGNLAPVASTVFSFRQSGIVVTESGVAASEISRSFRLYAETGAVRTGLAVSNASAMAGALQFELLDFNGTPVASSRRVSIAAQGRLSLFINEIPGFANLPADFRGVLRISGNVPIAAVGVRGQYNERGEFLIATTPALPEDSPAKSTEVVFPHIATGAGYTTEFLLLSAGGDTHGTVDFISQSGESMSLPIQR